MNLNIRPKRSQIYIPETPILGKAELMNTTCKDINNTVSKWSSVQQCIEASF